MYMCFYVYQFCRFLWFFCYILEMFWQRGIFCYIFELFWQCGSFCFSVRFWNCSDSVVFFFSIWLGLRTHFVIRQFYLQLGLYIGTLLCVNLITFGGGLLVPGIIIRPLGSVSALTWFIKYTKYLLWKFTIPKWYS